MYFGGETLLVDATDFGDVRGVSSELLVGVNVQLLVGDFNGDQIPDVGRVETGEPIRVYDGSNLSSIAVSPAPPVPEGSHEFPSGAPAGAIDLDGDQIDEIVVVELGHDLRSWRIADGTFSALSGLPDAAQPCAPIQFVPGDFDGDGARDLAFPATDGFCPDAALIEPDEFTIKVLYSGSGAPMELDIEAFTQPSFGDEVASGDLDGSGTTDIVLQDRNRVVLMTSTGNDLVVWQDVLWGELGGQEGGHFAPLVADVDGDGDDDLILHGFGDNGSVSRIYWDQLLGEYFEFPAHYRPEHLSDLNADGRAEILVSIAPPDEPARAAIYWSNTSFSGGRPGLPPVPTHSAWRDPERSSPREKHGARVSQRTVHAQARRTSLDPIDPGANQHP